MQYLTWLGIATLWIRRRFLRGERMVPLRLPYPQQCCLGDHQIAPYDVGMWLLNMGDDGTFEARIASPVCPACYDGLKRREDKGGRP